jgi:prevent-host-death family protein
MTRTLNIAEAKAHLSELVASAAAGEDIIIAKAGKPMVQLTPVTRLPVKARRLGIWPHVQTPDEVLIGPLEPTHQAALEGALSDDEGISVPRA